MFRLTIAAAVLAISTLSASAASAASLPPPEAFGRLPAISDAALSPDGKTVALIGGAPDRRIVTIAPTNGDPSVAVNAGAVAVRGLRWVSNNYLIVRASYLMKGGVAGASSAYAYHTDRNLVLDRSGKVLTPLLGGKNDEAQVAASGLPIRAVLDTEKPTVIVEGLDYSTTFLTRNNNTRLVQKDPGLVNALWRVDVATGRGALIERGDPDTRAWLTDRTGAPRVRLDTDTTAWRWTLLGRAKGQGSWRILYQTHDRRNRPALLGYSDAEDGVYVSVTDPASGQDQIVRRRLSDGAETVIAKAQGLETVGMLWDADRLAPVAIARISSTTRYEWLAPEFGAAHATLTRVLKGRNVAIVDWSHDRSQFLVSAEADDAPPVWYMFDASRKELSPVGEQYPELKDLTLGAVSWYSYKARDGLTIPAALTLPAGGRGAMGKPPLIVLPHGGPASRDLPGFDWWAQFLASRGYAVLQPQFRGSGGYGVAFERAGEKEWGGKMQTDLLDGIADLDRKGAIDPARVCIIGASFGGYAALAGATLHPDVYKCAASVNGVADLGLIQGETARAYGADSEALHYWKQVIGSVGGDGRLIQATSPARHATDVRGPILLVVSEQDTTVPPTQTEAMLKALKAANKPVQIVKLAGDDHYLSKSAIRIQMLTALETFLATAMPAKR